MRNAVTRARNVATELADLHCRKPLTPRLLPLINAGLVCTIGYALAWLVVWAFQQSVWLGWAHALIVAPAGLALGAAVVRAALEVALAVLEIRDHAGELGQLPRRVGDWPAMRRLVALGEARVWSGRRDREE